MHRSHWHKNHDGGVGSWQGDLLLRCPSTHRITPPHDIHTRARTAAEDYHQQYLAKPGARPYCSAQPMQIALAPISEWVDAHAQPRTRVVVIGEQNPHHASLIRTHLVTQAPDCGVKNLLPPSYWAKHAPKPHCVIGAPNEQIKLGFVFAASAPVATQPASKPVAKTATHSAKLSKDDE